MYPRKKTPAKTFIEFSSMVPRLRYEGPYKKAIQVAEQYGFHLLNPLRVSADDRVTVQNTDLPHHRIALLRTYLERGFDGCTHPVHACYTTKVPYKDQIQLHLDVIGSDKPIVEAFVMHLVRTILEEHGYADTRVHLNSVGEDSSLQQFLDETKTFFREHLNILDPDTRQQFMDDPFAPFKNQNEHTDRILESAPQSIATLTDDARYHFYEVLEALETLAMPYRIDNRLVGTHHYTRHTICSIRSNENEQELAYGERYDNLARRAGLTRYIPSFGVTIELPTSATNENVQPYKREPDAHPHTYLVQLGNNAKCIGMHVAETLRKADVRFRTAFSEQCLRDQLDHAKALEVPTLVILGQKELLEGTAMVRDQKVQSQVTVPLEKVAWQVKKLI